MLTPEFKVETVIDNTAAQALHKIIMSFAAEMKALGDDIVLLIAHPHKFNDAHNDDYWCAVQSGLSYWEASHFFRYDTDDNWDRGAARIEERSRYDETELSDEVIQDRGAQVQSTKLTLARDMLGRLEKTNWRNLSKTAFGKDWKGHGIYLFRGGVWFLHGQYFGHDEGEIWYCKADGGFVHFAALEDMSDGIGRDVPIHFLDINPNATDSVSGITRDWFLLKIPEVSDGLRFESFQELSRLIAETSEQIRKTTDLAVVLKPYSRYFGGMRGTLQLADKHFQVSMGRCVRYATKQEIPPVADGVAALYDERKSASWKSLFEQSFNITLMPSERLELAVSQNETLLIFESSLFTLADAGLELNGLFRRCEIDAYLQASSGLSSDTGDNLG